MRTTSSAPAAGAITTLVPSAEKTALCRGMTSLSSWRLKEGFASGFGSLVITTSELPHLRDCDLTTRQHPSNLLISGTSEVPPFVQMRTPLNVADSRKPAWRFLGLSHSPILGCGEFRSKPAS